MAGAPEQQGEEKERFVKGLFDTIARQYDAMNLIMTAGFWRAWQATFRGFNGVQPGDRVLDVGCGTADLCLILAGQVGPAGRVVGLDLSENMLAVGRHKVERSGCADRVELIQGNALELPFPDGSFDVVTSGFMLRNVADLARALREMARVVRPGGRVVTLELSHPRQPLLRAPFRLYMERAIPLMGAWAAKRSRGPIAPYAWLPASWRGFPDAPGLARMLEEAGLTSVEYRPLTGGIACLHRAERPTVTE